MRRYTRADSGFNGLFVSFFYLRHKKQDVMILTTMCSVYKDVISWLSN